MATHLTTRIPSGQENSAAVKMDGMSFGSVPRKVEVLKRQAGFKSERGKGFTKAPLQRRALGDLSNSVKLSLNPKKKSEQEEDLKKATANCAFTPKNVNICRRPVSLAVATPVTTSVIRSAGLQDEGDEDFPDIEHLPVVNEAEDNIEDILSMDECLSVDDILCIGKSWILTKPADSPKKKEVSIDAFSIDNIEFDMSCLDLKGGNRLFFDDEQTVDIMALIPDLKPVSCNWDTDD